MPAGGEGIARRGRSNAVKHTEPGGCVTLRARAEGGRVCFDVEDTGIGIAEQDLPRLFNYFEQLGAKHAHGMKGAGIGLALTRALVEKLGGEVRVHSVLGQGSRFSVLLPRAEGGDG